MKNEIDILGLINKIQAQITALDQKVDTLINRPVPPVKPSQTPPASSTHLAVRPNDRNKGRVLHTAICADCKKECTIPFKPSGDRPVYCQDCFSRRKVINLSGIKVDDRPKEATLDIPRPQPKSKKKVVKAKKTVLKKKPAPKKKR